MSMRDSAKEACGDGRRTLDASSGAMTCLRVDWICRQSSHGKLLDRHSKYLHTWYRPPPRARGCDDVSVSLSRVTPCNHERKEHLQGKLCGADAERNRRRDSASREQLLDILQQPVRGTEEQIVLGRDVLCHSAHEPWVHEHILGRNHRQSSHGRA